MAELLRTAARSGYSADEVASAVYAVACVLLVLGASRWMMRR